MSALSVPRTIGVLIIIQMIGGGVVNFVVWAPLFGSPGFLVNAAAHSQQIALGVVMGLITSMVGICIAAAVFPIFDERARTLAVFFFALAVVSFAGAIAESATVMSMVSVSEAYAKAGTAAREQLETVRVIVASGRNWVHYIGRVIDGVTIFVFYGALYRLALVPRALAGFGLFAALLMIAAVGMPLFGHDVVFPLLAPLGLSQLMLAIWLITKGFLSR